MKTNLARAWEVFKAVAWTGGVIAYFVWLAVTYDYQSPDFHLIAFFVGVLVVFALEG